MQDNSFIKKAMLFLIIGLGVIIVDQVVKWSFVDGYRAELGCISFILTYNTGVAFSMLSDLGEWLKYIQIVLIVGMIVYFVYEKVFIDEHFVALAFILGGGISNIADRFMHIGVVDFFYWHCGFDFAVFNLADVSINFGVFLIALGFLRAFIKTKKAS